ncbi:hypothetical protein LPU83_pLPU83b_0265 (plasmid) [Rhizobium favelukesii]|uniref:Uncharacterized protein n=1 Tax=Rhizobium favelukesii TaxID=348824 RepID=W6RIW8_9HYPH|nr:hypothetical protein LPU83_pLPU83b_0265 [Rhizobium favelukesii]
MGATIGNFNISITHWQEHEIGCVVIVLIMDDKLECAFAINIIVRAQSLRYRGCYQPCPGGQSRIVSLQLAP